MNFLFILIAIFIIGLVLFGAFRRVVISSQHEPIKAGDFEVLEIKILKNTENDTEVQASALGAENLFAALHGLLQDSKSMQEHFSFEIVSSKTEGLRFYAVVPISMVKYVEGQIYAQYPEAQINVVQDYAQNLDLESSSFEVATLNFEKEDFFPIKTYKDLEVDPLTSITSVLAQVEPGQKMMLQYLIRPIADTWQEAGHTYVNNVREGIDNKGPSMFGNAMRTVAQEAAGIAGGVATGMFKYQEYEEPRGGGGSDRVRLTAVQELQVESIENKLTKMGFEG